MEIDGTLEGLQPYTIRGTCYNRVFYSHLDARRPHPLDVRDADLKPGDPITISCLLKTVMQIGRRLPQSDQDRQRPADSGRD